MRNRLGRRDLPCQHVRLAKHTGRHAKGQKGEHNEKNEILDHGYELIPRVFFALDDFKNGTLF
jgi:hypothetical protein